MSSDDDAVGLTAAFKKKPTGRRKSSAPPQRPAKEISFSPAAMFSDDGSQEGDTIHVDTPPPSRKAVAVRVTPKKINKREYKYYEAKDEVEEVLQEFSSKRGGEMTYEVRVFPEQTKRVSEQSIPRERRLKKVKVTGHSYAYISMYKGATFSVYPSLLHYHRILIGLSN
jgi:hypothetical protein